MSNWKVIKTKIEVFDHPDADRLQLGKVGTYQVVVQKGLYDGGETVVFAPEKSVLSGELEKEYKDYLVGVDRNRVKAMRLRNELSCGIIIPEHLVEAQCGRTIDELPDDEDISEILGITKYIPPVPTEMEGEAEPIEHDYLSGNSDVEQFGVYRADFVEGERVVCTEKLHGCIDADVIINTLEFGNLPIHEIVNGKLEVHVKSRDILMGEDVYALVKYHFLKLDDGDWFEITLENGISIMITGNNPVWLPELNCYRRVDELKEDNLINFDEKLE